MDEYNGNELLGMDGAIFATLHRQAQLSQISAVPAMSGQVIWSKKFQVLFLMEMLLAR